MYYLRLSTKIGLQRSQLSILFIKTSFVDFSPNGAMELKAANRNRIKTKIYKIAFKNMVQCSVPS